MQNYQSKILLVEDDRTLGFHIQKHFEIKGFKVEVETSGLSALKKFTKYDYDLYLLDSELRDLNGFSLVKELRSNENSYPIIIITSKTETQTEIRAFEAGVNILHKKPIEFNLLEAQINALLANKSKEERIDLKDLMIDIKRRLVVKDSLEILLTKSEFDLLIIFAKSDCRVFTRDDIIRRINGRNSDLESNSVDTSISRLRKKIGDDLIETVYKIGYRLNLKYSKPNHS